MSMTELIRRQSIEREQMVKLYKECGHKAGDSFIESRDIKESQSCVSIEIVTDNKQSKFEQTISDIEIKLPKLSRNKFNNISNLVKPR